MLVHQVELSEGVMDTLILLSRAWEAENSCFGYRANTRSDIEGNRVFLAESDEGTAGYLFGHMRPAENESSVIPEGSRCFEVEELYVIPSRRSEGLGAALFRCAEDALKGEADFITLSTATKNWRSILHFYLDELDMTFWSARLFKKLG